MNNRVALVNRELHLKLFDNPLEEQEDPDDRSHLRYRKKRTQPEAVLKGMIKRGLSHTSNTPIARPRTAVSLMKHSRDSRSAMGRTNSVPTQEQLRLAKKKTDAANEGGLDYDFNPMSKEFEEYDDILKVVVKLQ